MREYLLSAAAVIALMASGAAASDKPVALIDGLGDHHHIIATNGNSPAKEVLGVGAAIVDARIALKRGDLAQAVSDLGVAVAMQDKLAYNEPADWHYPVRESLGAALLKSGRAADAEAVFRADLTRNPRSGRSQFGLAQALAAQGKADEAMLVRQEFDDAWHTAEIEPDLDTM